MQHQFSVGEQALYREGKKTFEMKIVQVTPKMIYAHSADRSFSVFFSLRKNGRWVPTTFDSNGARELLPMAQEGEPIKLTMLSAYEEIDL